MTATDRGSGQGLVEYGLMLLLVATVAAVSLLLFGDQLASILNTIAGAA